MANFATTALTWLEGGKPSEHEQNPQIFQAKTHNNPMACISLFHIAYAIDREGEDDQPTWNHLQHRRRTLDHHVQHKSVF